MSRDLLEEANGRRLRVLAEEKFGTAKTHVGGGHTAGAGFRLYDQKKENLGSVA
jgi:nanoRNase/pAp phosphatase (c-di-AMP/oligoRNAs hydrolase)